MQMNHVKYLVIILKLLGRFQEQCHMLGTQVPRRVIFLKKLKYQCLNQSLKDKTLIIQKKDLAYSSEFTCCKIV